MNGNDRFVRVYKHGMVSITEVWVDRATGVNYLYHQDGYSGGLTPLLGPDGKPVVTPIS